VRLFEFAPPPESAPVDFEEGAPHPLPASEVLDEAPQGVEAPLDASERLEEDDVLEAPLREEELLEEEAALELELEPPHPDPERLGLLEEPGLLQRLPPLLVPRKDEEPPDRPPPPTPRASISPGIPQTRARQHNTRSIRCIIRSSDCQHTGQQERHGQGARRRQHPHRRVPVHLHLARQIRPRQKHPPRNPI
jgi:hypothetical protein